jgi:hypothetical protein
VSGDNTLGPGAPPSKFGIARFGLNKFASEVVDTFRKFLPMNMNGYSCYVSIEQNTDDITFQILAVTLEGEAVMGRFV